MKTSDTLAVNTGCCPVPYAGLDEETTIKFLGFLLCSLRLFFRWPTPLLRNQLFDFNFGVRSLSGLELSYNTCRDRDRNCMGDDLLDLSFGKVPTELSILRCGDS